MFKTYTREGLMFVGGNDQSPPPLVAADWEDCLSADLINASRSSWFYIARYELEGDRVVHQVVASLFHRSVGERWYRRFELLDEGRVLQLSSVHGAAWTFTFRRFDEPSAAYEAQQEQR